jgi:hypothetical protein
MIVSDSLGSAEEQTCKFKPHTHNKQTNRKANALHTLAEYKLELSYDN